jgi:hypothetical protein
MVISVAVFATDGLPGAELPGSSATDTGVDGTLSRPRGLFATTK